MVTSVSYARLYNLGNYENEKLEVTVHVEDGDVAAAFITAQATVENEHQRMVNDRRGPTYQQLPTPATLPAPTSDKQRQYIARLMDDLGWNSEQIAAYTAEQNIDLVVLTSPQASKLISDLKRRLDVQLGELPF